MRELDLFIGKTLANRFEVLRLLGKGGMGSVYLAQDKRFGKQVVIKVPTMLQGDKEFKDRFMQEIASLATLEHPNIVPILDWGELDGIPYLVLRYLAGGNLRDRLKDSNGIYKLMPLEGLSQWLLQIAYVLDHIHSKGWVHRDLKPDNILFDEGGNPYLADFGIAKALDGASSDLKTTLGAIIGTPLYMAPEMHMGREIGPRGDQFGLAVLVYEALAGKVPFSGPTPAAIFWDAMQGQAKPIHEVVPEIPEEISRALMQGLASDPKQRYASCVEFAQSVLGTQTIREPGSTYEAVHSRESLAITQRETPAPGMGVETLAEVCRGSARDFKPAEESKDTFLKTPGIATLKGTSKEDMETLGGTSPKKRGLRKSIILIVGTIALLAGISLFMEQYLFVPKGESQLILKGVAEASLPGKDDKSLPKKDLKSILSSIENGFEFIPPGIFIMGSTEEDPDREPDEVPHEVTISRPFYMARHETTQEEWEAIMENNPSSVRGRTFPVTNVSHKSAMAFIKVLNEKTKGGYRLPTEAEWEYACRAGTKTPYSTGSTITSNQATFEGDKAVPVGSYKPNAFGLYDMHGNVWEWCQDWYGPYTGGPATDPTGPANGAHHVLRGGSFYFPATSLRSANRSNDGSPSIKHTFFRGIRLARTIPDPAQPPKK